jgi:hypothetical protein
LQFDLEDDVFEVPQEQIKSLNRSVLLTTANQSRVLQDHIEVADHFFTQTEAEEVIRDGNWVTYPAAS